MKSMATVRADLIALSRQRVLDAAYCAHPERFVHAAPKVNELPPAAVWINPPADRSRVEIALASMLRRAAAGVNDRRRR